MSQEQYPFFNKLIVDSPQGAAKYMGHLAKMILSDCPGNARDQIVAANISKDPLLVEEAQQRDRDLRDKFLELNDAFMKEHVILGNMVDHGSARYIADVLYEEHRF